MKIWILPESFGDERELVLINNKSALLIARNVEIKFISDRVIHE